MFTFENCSFENINFFLNVWKTNAIIFNIWRILHIKTTHLSCLYERQYILYFNRHQHNCFNKTRLVIRRNKEGEILANQKIKTRIFKCPHILTVVLYVLLSFCLFSWTRNWTSLKLSFTVRIVVRLFFLHWLAV